MPIESFSVRSLSSFCCLLLVVIVVVVVVVRGALLLDKRSERRQLVVGRRDRSRVVQRRRALHDERALVQSHVHGVDNAPHATIKQGVGELCSVVDRLST